MESLLYFLPSKIPSDNRRFGPVLLFFLLVWCPCPSRAQEGALAKQQLTESDVVRLASDRAPDVKTAQAIETLAEARTRTSGLFKNPGLNWSRETVHSGPISGQGSQDLIVAAVPLDFARPLTTRSLVASDGAWTRAEAALMTRDAVLEAVLSYYEVVLAEARMDVLRQNVENLDEASRVLARREAAGSASGYESTRLSVESELSRSHLAEAKGTLLSARARLAGLLNLSGGGLRTGSELSLMTAEAAHALSRASAEERPALKLARSSEELATRAEDRAAWAWLPVLELEGGLKRANNAGTHSGYGYVLGAALTLPLFDHGQAQRSEANAQLALSRARTVALARRIDVEVQSSLLVFLSARKELERFEKEMSGKVDALLTAAQSGYREGERSILELLDAQRAQTDVAERRLTLMGTAKRAEARLRAAVGALK